MHYRPVAMNDAWSVYILRCEDGSLYTGASNDVAKRLAKHAAGKGAAYTRSRLPVTLVFQEPAPDKGAALRREAQIKRLSRQEKLLLLKPAARRASKAAASRASDERRPR
jgi:putative endonuclease